MTEAPTSTHSQAHPPIQPRGLIDFSVVPNPGLAKGLVASIVVMTLAIAFMGGLITGGVIAGLRGGSAGGSSSVDASAAAEVVVTLPVGAQVVSETISDDRLVITYVDGASGARRVLMAPAPRGAGVIRYDTASSAVPQPE